MSNSQLQWIRLGAKILSLAAKIRRFVLPQIVSLIYRIVSPAIFVLLVLEDIWYLKKVDA